MSRNSGNENVNDRENFAGRIGGWHRRFSPSKPSGISGVKPDRKQVQQKIQQQGNYMRQGKVEWYSTTRGFGILSAVAADGALDKFYVHVTKIIKSPETIKQGQLAEFEINPIPPRRPADLPMAVNVTITEATQANDALKAGA
jgi:cold shock CspA family protein